MKPIVFAGPSLPAADICSLLDAEVRGPAAQGDIYLAALRRPPAIGIIDGYFELQPSVWHKEILWAMNQGIHVFGAASMGALRAAELEQFGMTGVGEIFEAFRDGVLEDDDEVAVAHAGQENGYRSGSDAMVSIRATLRKATCQGVIDQATASEAEALAKSLFYADRCYAHLLDALPQLAPLRSWLPANAVNLKRNDAVAMVETMRDFLASDPGPKFIDFVFEESLWWETLRNHETGRDTETADLEVLAELEESPAHLERARTGALAWWLADLIARTDGEPLTALEILSQSEEFCDTHGIVDGVALEKWLAAHRCSQAELDRIFESAALASRAGLKAGGELRAFLLRYLRWSGDYPALLRRIEGVRE